MLAKRHLIDHGYQQASFTYKLAKGSRPPQRANHLDNFKLRVVNYSLLCSMIEREFRLCRVQAYPAPRYVNQSHGTVSDFKGIAFNFDFSHIIFNFSWFHFFPFSFLFFGFIFLRFFWAAKGEPWAKLVHSFWYLFYANEKPIDWAVKVVYPRAKWLPLWEFLSHPISLT